MTIDWSNFTPWAALAGGAVIGLDSPVPACQWAHREHRGQPAAGLAGRDEFAA